MKDTTLRISEGLSLPVEVVTQAIGILAKRRAGKSYLARRFVEQLFAAGQQVVVVDPKGDWWGARSSADGKGAGLPIVIFGGERGDVPLEPGAGALVAKLIVEERVSALLDLSLLRKHEVVKFMTPFLEDLYRLKAHERHRTPLMLAIDEADAIAPQKPQMEEARMLGAAQDIVRRGGQRGLGTILITQRSAVLSKDVLTQVEMLITLRTIAPQDLAAVKAWIEVHGTIEGQKTLMASLPSLPIGDAWFWSPGWPTDRGIFQRAHTLPIETFDSGATPKPGQKRVEPKRLADVDLGAIRTQMAETIERAKADDPKALRARIAELEKAAKAKPAPDAKPEAERVEVPVFDEEAFRSAASGAQQRIDHATDLVGKAYEVLRGAREGMAQDLKAYANAARFKVSRAPKLIIAPGRPAHAPYAVQPRRVSAPVSNGHTEKMPTAERRILTALAQSGGQATKRKVALLAGYAVSGGGFNNALSSCRTKDWINGSAELELTTVGTAALGPYEDLPSGREALQHWIRTESKCEAAILTALDEGGGELAKEQVAEAAGYAVDGGGFNNALSRLRTLELIEGSSTISLSEELRA